MEVDQEQPLWYGNDNYDDVIDRTTGGMFITAQRYNASFWIEGAKHIDTYPPLLGNGGIQHIGIER